MDEAEAFDKITAEDRTRLDEIAEQCAEGATMCSQISLGFGIMSSTDRELHEIAVKLTGISARLSRISIVADVVSLEDIIALGKGRE
jgi:hypothetical protein